MGTTTTTKADPNRIIGHAIASGLKSDEPWLIILGVAFVLLIVILTWTGFGRRSRTL